MSIPSTQGGTAKNLNEAIKDTWISRILLGRQRKDPFAGNYRTMLMEGRSVLSVLRISTFGVNMAKKADKNT